MTLAIAVYDLPAVDNGRAVPVASLPDLTGSTTLNLDTDSAAFVGPCMIRLSANVDLLWDSILTSAGGSPTPFQRLSKGDREWYRIKDGVSIKFRATAG